MVKGGRDLHERGRLRQVEARELGVFEGVVPDRRDRGGDNERAPKVSGIEGAVPDLQERGRLRQIEARELGLGEGVSTDGLHGRAHLERALV